MPGLDDILLGGLAAGRVFLLEGSPGHRQDHHGAALPDGRRAAGERGLYVTLSETADELRAGAASHGWDARRQDRDLRAGAAREPARCRPAAEPALFLRPRARRDHQADLRGRRAHQGQARSCSIRLSEIRLLAQSSLRYRRQILALKHYFARHGATVLLLDDLTADTLDKTVHSVAHGVMRLEELAPDYGAERRRAAGHQVSRPGVPRRLPRLRHPHRRRPGLSAPGGGRARRSSSASRMATGIAAWTRCSAAASSRARARCCSARPAPARALLTLQFVAEAIRRGGKAAMFIFDEELGLLFDRAKPLGIDLAALRDAGAPASSTSSMPPSCRPANSPTTCATAVQDPATSRRS